MPKYSIADLDINEHELRNYYDFTKPMRSSSLYCDLDYIFDIAIENRDRFPYISLTGDISPKSYIERWVKGYCDALDNPPSKRMAKPKSACSDPAIAVIVKESQGMTLEEVLKSEQYHNLFMSAENIQGNLLEEYIAAAIRPYGFLWCSGNVLRAIDFCSIKGSVFLQIKNKYNTENSSSSNIREGTMIKKWYRLGTKTDGGVLYPNFKWTLLNDLINQHRAEGLSLPPCNMSEDAYEDFLFDVSSANHFLITGL